MRPDYSEHRDRTLLFLARLAVSPRITYFAPGHGGYYYNPSVHWQTSLAYKLSLNYPDGYDVIQEDAVRVSLGIPSIYD